MTLSLKAVLLLVLLAQTLLPYLPLQLVRAAEQQDQVFFGDSWSIGLWSYNTPISLSQYEGAVSLTVTPDFCAGAYVGMGWPFQFTAQYPDSIVGENKVGFEQFLMKLGNQAAGTSSGGEGCESLKGQGNIFEAFAGIKAKMTVDLGIDIPELPEFPDCTCNGWPWNWPCCIARWTWNNVIKPAYDGFMSVVKAGLDVLGVSLPLKYSDTVDLGDFLGGVRPYMELAWGAGSSPVEQTIGPLQGNIPPIFLNIYPPIISNPGVMTIGFGAAVTVYPWADTITGKPHVDGGNIVSTSSEGKTETVGASWNLGSFESIFSLRHQGIPPGNNPLPVTISLKDLQQYMHITTSISPTLTIHIIAWDLDTGPLIKIPLGDMQGNLKGTPSSLVYQTEVASALTDLALESVEQLPLDPAAKLFLRVGVRNKGALPVAVAGYKSFEVYEGTNRLVRIVPYPEGGGLEANKNYGRDIEVPVDKLSSPIGGYHILRVIVNPDKTVSESRYDNNEKTCEVKVLPELTMGQMIVNPANPAVGETVTISVVVWNSGIADAAAEGYRSFAVYDRLSSVSPDYGTWQLAKTIYQPPQGMYAPGLAPGKSWFATVWTGKFSQYGDHEVTVFVDPDDAVEEYDETNNAITKTIHMRATIGVTITATKPPPMPFDFSITARPSSRSISPGGSAGYSVVVTLISGAGRPVTLSVTGLPAGASSSLNPSKGTPNPYLTSTLTITTSARIRSGTYTLTIVATGGGITRYTSVTLTVASLTR